MRNVNPSVEAAIKTASPINYKGDPIFRAIWSPDSMDWAAGWWNEYDNEGYLQRRVWESRYVPKYHFAPRWIIERWFPGEFFCTREQWDSTLTEFNKTHGTMLELGPYPSEGKYLFTWKCEDVDGQYLELTPHLAEHAIHLALLPIPSEAEMRSEAASKEQSRIAAGRKKMDDMLGDAFPFLGRVSNLNPLPLLQKIRAQRKEGKEI